MKKKRGLSPTIASILLVALVIISAMIVFLWFRSFSHEAVTKMGDKNIELVCKDVDFRADYQGGILYISNQGDVPIYSLSLKKYKEGGYDTLDIKDLSNKWPLSGLPQGGTFSDTISFTGSTKIIVIPVLAGNSESGQRFVPCEEKDGFKIEL
jgi:flagellin-like protein